MGKLEGKTILLTGASSGIGKQTAIRLAEEGASLVICARRVEKLNETKSICEKAGAKVVAIPCDLTNQENLTSLVDETIKTFGKIDVLINNGISSTAYVPFMQQTLDDVAKVMNSGFIATWTLMQLCYPHMKANGGGSIINVGSGSAEVGLSGFAAYAAIKAAVISLSKVAANEWGTDNIRVNVLNPAGFTDSMQEGKLASAEILEITKAQLAGNAFHRPGDPYSDIAPVIAFLASDDSRFMTGQVFRVEGGTTMA